MVIQFFVSIKILIYAMAWSPCKASEFSSVFIFKWFNSASDCQVLKYEPLHLWVTQFNQAVALPSESFLGVNLTVPQTHKNILVKISRVNSSPPLSKPHRPPPLTSPQRVTPTTLGLIKRPFQKKKVGELRGMICPSRDSLLSFSVPGISNTLKAIQTGWIKMNEKKVEIKVVPVPTGLL